MSKGLQKRGNRRCRRFCAGDGGGRRVRRECAGNVSQSGTLCLPRGAAANGPTAGAGDITVGEALDLWMEEELKPGSRSNGTVIAYQGAINRIKKHPLGGRRLKTVRPEHLQDFFDRLSLGEQGGEGPPAPPVSKGYMLQLSAVLKGAFGFAAAKKRLIPADPMQQVKLRGRAKNPGIFPEQQAGGPPPVITHRQYLQLTELLERRHSPAALAVRIAYYTGLRLGEVCALSWRDVNIDEQYLTVRRSMRYNGVRHRTELGPAKGGKIRTVDFGDALADILREARRAQQPKEGGGPRFINYYRPVSEKQRSYYEVYSLPASQAPPGDYSEMDFICTARDGSFTPPNTVSRSCRSAREKLEGLPGFHFHMLRHPYVKHTTKIKSLQKQKTQAIVILIA